MVLLGVKDLVENDVKNNLCLLNLLDFDEWFVFFLYLFLKWCKLIYEKIFGVESG